MKAAAALLCLAMSGMAADGLPPRGQVSDYPVHSGQEGLAMGAALLSQEQVRGSFSTDLNRGYVVVEVGLYPRGELDVSLLDFSLRVAGTHTVSRPVSPRVIAGVLQKTAPGGRDISLYPSVGVAHTTGPYGGTSTGVGVGVGVGGNGPPPASTDQDRKTMELELREKGLPEGKSAQPVAGYLYFPLPGKKRNVAFDLEYRSHGERITLPLVSEPRK